MAFDSQRGLYFQLKIRDQDVDLDANAIQEIHLESSIEELFPAVNIKIPNRENFYPQNGYATVGAPFKLTVGGSVDDAVSSMDILANYVMDNYAIIDASATMEGKLKLVLQPKVYEKYKIKSAARAFAQSSTSDAIRSLVSSDFQTLNIESCSTRGNFLKPSNQSIMSFLQLLKNRSISSQSSPSKMFMWVGFDGSFNFKSLNTLINQNADVVLDFTGLDAEIYSPGDFAYVNEGIHHENQYKNTTYKSYKFKQAETESGNLSSLVRPTHPPMGGSQFSPADTHLLNTTTNSMLMEYQPSSVSENYNQALYNNLFFNFPYMFSFTMFNHPQVKVGNKIKLVFPHNGVTSDPAAGTLYDTAISNEYLVYKIMKKVANSKYVTKIFCCTNSRFSSDLTTYLDRSGFA